MNKIMFIVGLIMALTAATMLFIGTDELRYSPIVLGIIGIVFIAVSRKQKKK